MMRVAIFKSNALGKVNRLVPKYAFLEIRLYLETHGEQHIQALSHTFPFCAPLKENK